MPIARIGVIGAGQMGAGIAHVAALGDRSSARVRADSTSGQLCVLTTAPLSRRRGPARAATG